MRQIREAEQGLDITSFLEGDSDYHKPSRRLSAICPIVSRKSTGMDKHDLKDLAFKVHALKGWGDLRGLLSIPRRRPPLKNRSTSRI